MSLSSYSEAVSFKAEKDFLSQNGGGSLFVKRIVGDKAMVLQKALNLAHIFCWGILMFSFCHEVDKICHIWCSNKLSIV